MVAFVALSALAALLPSLVSAATCVQFDSSFNLYAFGGEKDVKLGPQSAWASPSPTDLTATGRPPFDGDNMQCFFAQYANAMYVFGGDKSDVGSIYIYDFAADSWSKQTTTGAPAQLSNSRSAAILDHDTNVLFSIPGGGKSMYSLDLGKVENKATGTAAWTDDGTPAINTDGATTAALSNNHISFFGVPGTPAGSANMYVIHTSAWQATPATFTAINGADNFPDTTGQAVSFFLASNAWQQSMLFIPDDFSNSYVVTHWTNPGDPASMEGLTMATNLVNSTQTFSAPTSQDKQAAYACSDTSCVQIDSKGDIYAASNCLGTDFIAKPSTWTKLSYSVTGSAAATTDAATNSTSTGASGSASGSASAAGGKASATGSHTASGSSSANSAAGTTAADKAGSGAAPSLSSGVFTLTLGALAVAAASLF